MHRQQLLVQPGLQVVFLTLGNNRTHMIRVPDPGRFELRLMDGSANPYLLQAGVLAALFCNMYTDHKKYPNLKKLPNTLEEDRT